MHVMLIEYITLLIHLLKYFPAIKKIIQMYGLNIFCINPLTGINKNKDIEFRGHDKHAPLIIKRLESQIIQKLLGASKPNGPNTFSFIVKMNISYICY